MKYQAKIDSLTIKRTILTHTMFFLPIDQRNTIQAKLNVINNKIDYYKAISHIDLIGYKQAYYLFRSIQHDNTELMKLADNLLITNPGILRNELRLNARDYLEMKS